MPMCHRISSSSMALCVPRAMRKSSRATIPLRSSVKRRKQSGIGALRVPSGVITSSFLPAISITSKLCRNTARISAQIRYRSSRPRPTIIRASLSRPLLWDQVKEELPSMAIPPMLTVYLLPEDSDSLGSAPINWERCVHDASQQTWGCRKRPFVILSVAQRRQGISVL